jgi:hypothetical protein
MNKLIMKAKHKYIISLFIILVVSGCSMKYTTPGGGVELSKLSDVDINKLMSIEPSANFPANIAIARVQASGYSSMKNQSYGSGRYSVVTTRDVEQDKDIERIENMPMVSGLGPLNRIILPSSLDTIKDLRVAAARLKADILLIYTFDTAFHVGAQKYRPLNVISLGLLNNKDVTVTTTASAAFFDVRTEYLYGLTETSAQKNKKASVWGSSDVVDDLRIETEKEAFTLLVDELEKTWGGIIKTYSKKT